MANELETGLLALLNEIGADIKALRAADGDVNALTTNAKVLQQAINEIHALVQSAGAGDMLRADNLSGLADYVAARTNLDVLSSSQVTSLIASITLASLGAVDQATVDASVASGIAALVGTAPETLNTLQEIAAEIESDNTAFAALTTTVSTKVSFTTAQPAITPAQRQIACENIGIGNPNADFLGAYTTARDA